MITSNSMGASWTWIKQGAGALHGKPSLWSLPVLDCGTRLIIWALTWYVVVGGWVEHGPRSVWVFALLPAWSLAAFIKAYFSVALAHGLTMKEDGEITINESLRHSGNMKWTLLKWSWLNAGASLIFSINGTRGIFGQVINTLGQISWKMATLITPALLARGLSPINAIEGSAHIVMDRFGPSASGTAGLWGVFHLIQGALSFLGFIAVWAMVMTGRPIVGVACGFAAGLAILGLRAYEAAITTAFSVQILSEFEQQG